MTDTLEADRRRLTVAANTIGVPEHVIEGLVEYVLTGRRTGSFLEAVIAGDLFDALGRADDKNRRKLFEIASWLYNHAPGESYGSRNAYANWLRVGGLRGTGDAS